VIVFLTTFAAILLLAALLAVGALGFWFIYARED
jgi:hypothetical protein